MTGGYTTTNDSDGDASLKKEFQTSCGSPLSSSQATNAPSHVGSSCREEEEEPLEADEDEEEEAEDDDDKEVRQRVGTSSNDPLK